MRTLKAGVIGTGFIGPAHVEALRRTPGVQVAAIASIEIEKARSIADQYGISVVHERWQEVVGDPGIDVVHNCTPNNLHFTINKAALLAGKHVVSEKPLTLTAKESAELVRLAARTGAVTAIDFNYRFYPLMQHVRSMLAKGELGRVFLVHGHYLQDWLLRETDYNWRLDAKISGASRAVADIGSHWCDLVQFVTGLRIVRVCADLATFHRKRLKPRITAATFAGTAAEGVQVPVDTEDAGIIMLECEQGVRGVVTVSQVSAGRKNREWFEVDGSRGSVAWNQEDPNRLWIGHRDRPNEVLIKDPSLLTEEARPYAHFPGGHPEGFPDGLKNLCANVYRYIRDGKDPRKDACDFPTFADGDRENRIVEAVLRSNAKKRWVAVD